MLDALVSAEVPMTLRDLAVSGGDLMTLGFPQGKEIGVCLNALLDRVIEGSLPNERGALLDAARKYREEHPDGTV